MNMADKTDHVIKRDGNPPLAEPRPAPPGFGEKAAAAQEAEAGARFGGNYSDPSYVGWRDERASFEAASGNPSPRQRAQRGEQLPGEITDTQPPDGVSLKPGDKVVPGGAAALD